MIVRISGEDQYRLADADGRLETLDRDVIAAVEGKDEAAFRAAFAVLLDYVRDSGEPLSDDELEPSDVILPPVDTTLAEAGSEFTGEGLNPD